MTGAYNIKEKPNNQTEISLVDETSLDESKKKLNHSVKETNRMLNKIFYGLKGEHSDKYQKHIDELKNIAEDGMKSDDPKLVEVMKSADEIQEKIVKEDGPLIESSYLKQLTITAGIFAVISFIIGVALSYWAMKNIEIGKIIKPFTCYFFIWTGSMIGLWLSRITKRINMTKEEIMKSQDKKMLSWIRLIFAGIVAVFVFAIMKNEIFEITVGGLTPAKVTSNPEIAIIFGAFAGLLDSKLANNILNMIKDTQADTQAVTQQASGS